MSTENLKSVATQRGWTGIFQERNQIKPVLVATRISVVFKQDTSTANYAGKPLPSQRAACAGGCCWGQGVTSTYSEKCSQ